MGICLGMQLLLGKSEELGGSEGLNLIPGQVNYFHNFPEFDSRYKEPHVGWNTLEQMNGSYQLLMGLEKKSSVYFVHSLVAVPEKKEYITSQSEYGNLVYASIIQNGNIVGCQFHPEKSGTIGLKLLKNMEQKLLQFTI